MSTRKAQTVDLTTTTAADFLRLYSAVRDAHPHGDALTAPEDVNLTDATCYVTTDRRSGFVVAADGDARYLFSAVGGRGDALVAAAVARGARTLDCFDGYLPALYARHGFRIVRREQHWTPGGPDVVYMARD